MTGRTCKMPSEKHDLHFQEPVRRWDEALPLGNGLIGCLVWGDGLQLRLSLDRGDLWDKRVAPETLDSGFTYANMVKLARNGEQDELARRFDHFYSKCPYPTKLPAGRLELRGSAAAKQMESRLSVRHAEAEVNWLAEGRSYRMTTFLHAETKLGYIRLEGEHVHALELTLVPPDYAGIAAEREDKLSNFNISLTSLGYPCADLGSEGETRWFYQRTNHGLEYAVIVAASGKSDHVMEFVYTVAANLDGVSWFEDARLKVRAAAEAGYEEALPSHRAWWESFWSQSELTLPEFQFEKQWYLTNYLFASCSRKGAPPMPLQGVWTADEGNLPPWKGDYHNDLNTQLSYWHYMKANHLQEGESFIDFLWGLLPQARAFAARFYETSGINLPSVMTIDGNPLGGWPMYSLSPTNQIWLCQAFDHYWLYTGDREFLETRAYVYFKETAECLLGLLHPGEDGKLCLPVSSSPEIHDSSLQSWLTPNSNYDLSLIRYLFTRLEQMAELLEETVDRQRWTGVIDQLPDLAVNETGLMISPDESLTVSHRHHSHAMAIYPLRLLDYRRSDADKQIIDRTVYHLETLGKGFWVGYSFPWTASIYIQQGNGEAARYHLLQFWNYLCSPNGFHLNGDYKHTGLTQARYRPFTLEGNMAAADALQEMLLQTNGGVIRTFPAIPADWLKSAVEFRRFRGEMGVLVSAKITGGHLEYVELYAERGGSFLVENRFQADEVLLDIDGSVTALQCLNESEFPVELKKGETCRIIR
ncbi:glycosyl hydrolase family 95 catalytic domain-containing protein [Paenibacillus montanisoli]|uniref:Uncharacterized protein n=1 Tax=Paenibacillus montanisoli TaxID=2081970 RepID=A0A328U2I6_9BACL|nr:glycoside hydrolase N-terminal domain-containing protein [Paenibacillus montanisoli]RAP77007.1 hypothetical protein DL346_00420 [Paenibacillus montanisoli]